MTIKIILADDDQVITEGLRIILRTDKELEVLKTFNNGVDAVKYCLENMVDIALLDVRMPILNGVDATKDITEKSKTKVIALTTFNEDECIEKAIKFGAKGYILKNDTPEKIINIIKVINSHNKL
ncbi:response regulator [Clostridium paraputrificum]|uniref:response regulator n=1 Tax=Clostridium TaxID=1485 RepID=UPI003D32B3BB